MTGAQLILAIDGGATKTRVGLYDSRRTLVTETSGGPSNPFVCGVDASVRDITTLCLRCLQFVVPSQDGFGVSLLNKKSDEHVEMRTRLVCMTVSRILGSGLRVGWREERPAVDLRSSRRPRR